MKSKKFERFGRIYYAYENGVVTDEDGKIKKASFQSKGYLILQFFDKTRNRYIPELVHRIIAKTFIKNPDGLKTVNHINGVKADNRVKNLEWVSISDNLKHAHTLGLINPHGKNNGKAVLDEIEALAIYSSQAPPKFLSEIYGISQATISLIKSKSRWAHIHNDVLEMRKP